MQLSELLLWKTEFSIKIFVNYNEIVHILLNYILSVPLE